MFGRYHAADARTLAAAEEAGIRGATIGSLLSPGARLRAGSYLVLALLAALAVLIAGFVRLRLPAFIDDPLKTSLARLLLYAVGVGVGYAVARLYYGDGMAAAPGRLTGFGVVHVPAACILMLKRARRATVLNAEGGVAACESPIRCSRP